MSHHQTLTGLNNVISSPELAAGRLPSASLASPMITLAGQEAHRASHSVQRENNSDNLTRDILHRHSCGSLNSAALQSSLESKLKQRLGNTGSMIYSMNWKMKTTPAQRQYCQLQASALLTKESASVLVRSWATVTARSGKDSGNLSKSFFRRDGRMRNDTLYRQMWLHTFGLTGNPTRVQMVRLECYLPDMARLLMGFPQEWSYCAVMGTR